MEFMYSRSLFLCFVKTVMNSAFKNILEHSHYLIDTVVETAWWDMPVPSIWEVSEAGRLLRVKTSLIYTVSSRPDEAV